MDKYYRPNEVIKEYSIIKIIGQGKYGIVYLAENDNNKYIIKQLKKEHLEKTKDKLFYEEDILKSLNYSYFPKFIDSIDDDIRGYIMEYIEGKVFEDLLFKENIKFSKEDIFKIGNQLLDIIHILHHNNIIHRDIRPPNVILKENNELVLLDFGLARYIDDKKYVKEMDYWYLGDFLIHLYYSSYYKKSDSNEKPWFEELDISEDEIMFLKKLMGIEPPYTDIESIRADLNLIK